MERFWLIMNCLWRKFKVHIFQKWKLKGSWCALSADVFCKIWFVASPFWQRFLGHLRKPLSAFETVFSSLKLGKNVFRVKLVCSFLIRLMRVFRNGNSEKTGFSETTCSGFSPTLTAHFDSSSFREIFSRKRDSKLFVALNVSRCQKLWIDEVFFRCLSGAKIHFLFTCQVLSLQKLKFTVFWPFKYWGVSKRAALQSAARFCKI